MKLYNIKSKQFYLIAILLLYLPACSSLVEREGSSCIRSVASNISCSLALELENKQKRLNLKLRSLLSQSSSREQKNQYKNVVNYNFRHSQLASYPAIESYTDSDYFRINNLLREGEGCNEKCEQVISELRTLKSFQGTAFRSVEELDPESIARLCIGCTFVNRGFWSSTADENQRVIIREQGGSSAFTEKAMHFFVIKSLTGKPIANMSHVKNEMEVLFEPNTSFKVTDIKEIRSEDESESEMVVFYLEEIL